MLECNFSKEHTEIVQNGYLLKNFLKLMSRGTLFIKNESKCNRINNRIFSELTDIASEVWNPVSVPPLENAEDGVEVNSNSNFGRSGAKLNVLPGRGEAKAVSLEILVQASQPGEIVKMSSTFILKFLFISVTVKKFT